MLPRQYPVSIFYRFNLDHFSNYSAKGNWSQFDEGWFKEKTDQERDRRLKAG